MLFPNSITSNTRILILGTKMHHYAINNFKKVASAEPRKTTYFDEFERPFVLQGSVVGTKILCNLLEDFFDGI